VTRSLVLAIAVAACSGSHGVDAGSDAGRSSDAGARACSHDVCAEGDYLEQGCDPCVAAICEEDDVCCGIVWDQSCVLATRMYPEVCACAAETACDDLRDDDVDGATDCADPDCASDAACAEGAGELGASCRSHADCAGDPPLCRHEPRHPNGFCSRYCDDGACGPDGACLLDEVGLEAESVCLLACDPVDPDACRDGYTCEESESGFVCRPRREICDTAEDEDLDGANDCEDRDCIFEPHCQEECTNGVDDTDNGDVDCEDYTCLGRVECDHPVCDAPPAARASTCVVLGGFVECNPVTNEGCDDGEVCDLGIGGYRCYAPAASVGQCAPCVEHGCAAGTTCVGFGPPGPDPGCWTLCCADSDCGPEGRCNKAITTQIIAQPSHIGVCTIDYER
jgi:hypothetical protein